MIQMSTQLSHGNWVNIVISQKNDHNFCGAFILTISFLCYNILSSVTPWQISVLKRTTFTKQFFADPARTGYCSTFHFPSVCPFVCHRRDISTFLNYLMI